DRVPGRHLARLADEAAVPGDGGLQLRLVGGIEPDHAAAPAEAGDAEPARVALAGRLGPGDGRVDVLHHLPVRHLGDDLADDRGAVGQLGHVALAGIELGRDGQVAELGEAAADILDVLVNAEDLLHHHDSGEGAALGRHGPVGRDVVVGYGNLDLARRQAG